MKLPDREPAGGEEEIWTPATITRPNGLANRPLKPLEYFSRKEFEQDAGKGHSPLHIKWSTLAPFVSLNRGVY